MPEAIEVRECGRTVQHVISLLQPEDYLRRILADPSARDEEEFAKHGRTLSDPTVMCPVDSHSLFTRGTAQCRHNLWPAPGLLPEQCDDPTVDSDILQHARLRPSKVLFAQRSISIIFRENLALQLTPLTHTTVNAMIKTKFETFSRVSKKSRVSKSIAYDLGSLILLVSSWDNLFHVVWYNPADHPFLFDIPSKTDSKSLVRGVPPPLSAVPFPVIDLLGNMRSIKDFNSWITKWGYATMNSISKLTKKSARNQTITEVIRNDHLAFAGCGTYLAPTIVQYAGISPWVLAYDCLNTPSRMARLFLAYAFVLFKSEGYCYRIRKASLSRDAYTLNVLDKEVVDYDKILFAHAKDSITLKKSMTNDLNDPNINTLRCDLFDPDLVDLTSTNRFSSVFQYNNSNSVHEQIALLATLHSFIYEPCSVEGLKLSTHPLAAYYRSKSFITHFETRLFRVYSETPPTLCIDPNDLLDSSTIHTTRSHKTQLNDNVHGAIPSYTRRKLVSYPIVAYRELLEVKQDLMDTAESDSDEIVLMRPQGKTIWSIYQPPRNLHLYDLLFTNRHRRVKFPV
ncbi:hypothetical protein FISHEDRAFT_59286 [Fistulina hepatica ATCC 64428]|uniref:Uncharacterized protein n=1 Tax=Fistulina hepatica ATCC 64428 TaxID=1128425 RepID=A0A0D7ADH4_9AGAR|nr:hypothetical protein FISHEDRAFT_59286 [Fistulina hepatica ATCC 64428]